MFMSSAFFFVCARLEPHGRGSGRDPPTPPTSLTPLPRPPFRPTRAEKTRLAIYMHLFKEGALVCEKDVKKLKHHELDLPNLHVAKAMLSLKSRDYVREVFNWCVSRGPHYVCAAARAKLGRGQGGGCRWRALGTKCARETGEGLLSGLLAA